ncbi:MAG: DUF3109 family protein [Bacteroidales bacterium]|nr:DUF3109 family protein [Bacteroidales bacterium]
MIEIGKTIISIDLLQCHFLCDLHKCKGACCVEGDSGAPLETDELEIMIAISPIVKEYMTEQGVKTIENNGTYVIDHDGDYVTPLNNGKECAYTFFEKGIARCAIEKAYEEGKIDFRKPISCHLYPVRVKKYEKFEGVNYDRWKICNPAILNGIEKKALLYQILKEPLIRKYGEEWYMQVEIAANNLDKMKHP